MSFCTRLAIVLLILAVAWSDDQAPKPDFSYCIVGAGPGGIQSAYFLLKRNADFVVFERGAGAGTFFAEYPRGRRLISINKRFTGKGGKTSEQFNLRHDWNSLLSDNETLRFTRYSTKYFAPAGRLVSYFQDFVNATGIQPHIRYGSSARIRRIKGSQLFQITVAETGEKTICRTVISAQGLWAVNRPKMVGVELAEEYQTMSVTPSDYTNQTVAILGNGNSALETANTLFNVTRQIHVIGRRPMRFSWQTHYVGDVRALNSAHLDRYQLVGGTDTVMEMERLPSLVKDPDGGIIMVPPWGSDPTPENLAALAAWKKLPADTPLSAKIAAYNQGARGYKDLGWMHVDRVLNCLGWRFDTSLFPAGDEEGTEAAVPELDAIAKYPKATATFESVNQKGLYFAGTLTHGRDFRKSSGGFIHGFRYNCRALDKWLAVRYEGAKWPSELLAPLRPMLMTDRVLGSANNGDGIYQMFGTLVDAVTLTMNSKGELVGRHYKEIPRELAERFTLDQFRFTMDLRYGTNFSGPIFDVFSIHRVTNAPPESHLSNFLHPVVQLYVPGSTQPVNTFHILEDLRTDFTQSIHLNPTIEHFKELWKQLPSMIEAHLTEKAEKAAKARAEAGRIKANQTKVPQATKSEL
eukprot:TRINITY_DN6162_c0_g1_i1.p1 TRINITY_DN6162_c0_g1~~TRINITY_DN6162_c0_g1_i1.p1  ORF type:complete len:636 (+),score=109.67 TRINITY_DN6162_c0_g1_i1:190-2097(+)